MKKLMILSIAIASFTLLHNNQITAPAINEETQAATLFPTTYSVENDGSVNLLNQEPVVVPSESDYEEMPSIMVPSEETTQELVQEPLAIMEEDGEDALEATLQQAVDQANREVALLSAPESNTVVQEATSLAASSLESMVRAILAELLQELAVMLLGSNNNEAVASPAPAAVVEEPKIPVLENIDLADLLPKINNGEEDANDSSASLPA